MLSTDNLDELQPQRPKTPDSTDKVSEKKDVDIEAASSDAVEEKETSKRNYKPYILVGTAMVILGWWISSTVLEATRHRW